MDIQAQKQRFQDLLKNENALIEIGEQIVSKIESYPDVYHYIRDTLKSYDIEASMYMPSEGKMHMYSDILKDNAIRKFVDYKTTKVN